MVVSSLFLHIVFVGEVFSARSILDVFAIEEPSGKVLISECGFSRSFCWSVVHFQRYLLAVPASSRASPAPTGFLSNAGYVVATDHCRAWLASDNVGSDYTQPLYFNPG